MVSRISQKARPHLIILPFALVSLFALLGAVFRYIDWQQIPLILYAILCCAFLAMIHRYVPTLINVTNRPINQLAILILRVAGSLGTGVSIFMVMVVFWYLIPTHIRWVSDAYFMILLFVGLPSMGIMSYRWAFHPVFRAYEISRRSPLLADSVNALQSARSLLGKCKTSESLILADNALEKFLRYYCVRLGCVEGTVINVGTKERKFDSWGVVECMKWLETKNVFTEDEKRAFYKYHSWRNVVQHGELFAPERSVVRQIIEDVKNYIEKSTMNGRNPRNLDNP